MKRDGWKWALAGGAIALLIVYGLDSADNGIRNVYGPVGADVQPPAVNGGSQFAPATSNTTVERDTPASNEGFVENNNNNNKNNNRIESNPNNSYAGNERLPGVPYDTSEPTVNKLADGAAGVLQSVSSGGIKLFVSMFDGIMD
ncbi:hypothetical protein PCCS19_44360 [Paenibacillus sp. CCS19]|uniref:hypothetical protein n=1 Tax=Paenibacillus sp. CCS19 TaxID=3158387 RepID=UPI00255EEDB6|nr:hypothetical protein [Paenibacillus cellulosilyticus]GMK41380.1 hypothetical protein PCCS19_44360 [Paenibacillus cellulosilyticus]